MRYLHHHDVYSPHDKTQPGCLVYLCKRLCCCKRTSSKRSKPTQSRPGPNHACRSRSLGMTSYMYYIAIQQIIYKTQHCRSPTTYIHQLDLTFARAREQVSQRSFKTLTRNVLVLGGSRPQGITNLSDPAPSAQLQLMVLQMDKR